MSNEIRVYMATQANKTVGVTLDLSAKKANRFDITHEGTTTRISALEALVQQVEDISFDERKAPVQFFINDHLLKNINNGLYKYWLLTGCTSDGEVVEEKELDLWERFHQVYCENNIYVILKSTSEARISDSLKAMEGKKSKKTGKVIKLTVTAKQNDKYSSFCWDKVKELVGDIEDIDESELA